MKKSITSFIGIFALLFVALVINFDATRAANEDYVTTIPEPVEVTDNVADVQQTLEQHVQQMVDLGHLAPTLYFVGLGGRPAIFYATPSETIYTLSAAYPYLSAALQTQVKTYLDEEIRTYPPHNTFFYPPTTGTVTDFAGTPREYFQHNPSQTFNFFSVQDDLKHVSVLYSLWLFSHNTNDWNYVSSNYSALKNRYTAAKSDGKIDSYPELAGVIGFARIANQLNETADYNDALSFATQGVENGKNFTQFLETASNRYPNSLIPGHGYTTPLFLYNRQTDVNRYTVLATHFNRDIGLFLKDHAAEAAGVYAEKIANDLNLWWMNDVAMTWGENAYATPEISWTAFMLRAYVLNESALQLKQYLDAPTRKGDLLYIQKLVAVIEQGPASPDDPTATPTWTASPTSEVSPTATTPPDDEEASFYLPYVQNGAVANPSPTPTSPTDATTTPTPTSEVSVTPTSTTPPPTADFNRRINIPRIDGQTFENVNKLAVLWFGDVTDNENYVDVRVGYSSENSRNRLSFRVTAFDRYVWYEDNPSDTTNLEQWDATTLYLDTNGDGGGALDEDNYRFVLQMRQNAVDYTRYQAAYRGSATGWQPLDSNFTSVSLWQGGDTGPPNDNSSGADERGWRLMFFLPFAEFGLSGPPADGTVWNAAIVVHDRDSADDSPAIPDKSWPEDIDPTAPDTWGQLVFNPPAYQPPTADNTQTVTIRQGEDGVTGVQDATIGGGSLCGDNPQAEGWRSDWSRWGFANYGEITDLYIQNQDNVADWPCYSKSYLSFPLDKLPPGKVIVDAKMTLSHFGNSNPSEAPDSLIQLFKIVDPWQENDLTWNSAPLPKENILASTLRVPPLPAGATDELPRTWDVTQVVAEAYQAGEPMNVALYSADESLHTGKYFRSSDNGGNRPYVEITFGDGDTVAPTATTTGVPTSTPTQDSGTTVTSTPTSMVTMTATGTVNPTATTPPTATLPPNTVPTSTPIPTTAPGSTATPTPITPTATPTVLITASTTPTDATQNDPRTVGETDPDNPENPWYANGQLTVEPYPLTQGQLTTMTVVVDNPTTSTQTVDLEFYVSGLGMGQWWSLLETLEGINIAPSETITRSVTWYPATGGHFCSQVKIISGDQTRVLQRNLDVITAPNGGCHSQSFQLCNAFDEITNFDLNIIKQSGPEGSSASLDASKFTMAPGACTTTNINICTPEEGECGTYVYLVEPNPGQDGIMFEVDTCAPTPTPTPSTTPPPSQRVNLNKMDTATIRDMPIHWFGEIDPENNYAETRVGYDDKGLRVLVSAADRRIWYNTVSSATTIAEWDGVRLHLSTGDTEALSEKSYRFTAQLSDGEPRTDYQVTAQGEASSWVSAPAISFTSHANYWGTVNDATDDWGWELDFTIPFASLGLSNAPADGTVWRLGLEMNDRDGSNVGTLKTSHWPAGLQSTVPQSWAELVFKPSGYQPPSVTSTVNSLLIRHELTDTMVVEDAPVGGGLDCGAGADPWSEWGSLNYATDTASYATAPANIESGRAMDERPCFSKQYLDFPLDSLPSGKQVITGLLKLVQTGTASNTGNAYVQILTTQEGWDEATLTWNNAPYAFENVAGMAVDPTTPTDPPSQQRVFDISGAVADAYANNQTNLRLIVYTAEESGRNRHFTTSRHPNPDSRPSLEIFYSD